MTLLVHLLQYWLHLSEITDTNTKTNGLIPIIIQWVTNYNVTITIMM